MIFVRNGFGVSVSVLAEKSTRIVGPRLRSFVVFDPFAVLMVALLCFHCLRD